MSDIGVFITDKEEATFFYRWPVLIKIETLRNITIRDILKDFRTDIDVCLNCDVGGVIFSSRGILLDSSIFPEGDNFYSVDGDFSLRIF